MVRILVLTAHPDDVDFGAGASVAAWTAAGHRVSYCIATDGDAGGFDPAVARSEIPAIRRAEQVAAAAVMGVDDVDFLGWADGRVEPTVALRVDLARAIRRSRPDRVVTHNPGRSWDRMGANHPDHLAVGEAALCAVYPDARNPFAFPELADLEAHTVGEVWLMGGPDPDCFVDGTDTFDLKLAALRAHVSQETDRNAGLTGRMRAWMSEQARQGGLPDGRLAEAFRRIVTA